MLLVAKGVDEGREGQAFPARLRPLIEGNGALERLAPKSDPCSLLSSVLFGSG